jgi:predicted P-loop ATPase
MARLVPVFEGPENKGKTRCINLLGHPWSITFDMSMDSKEAHMAIQKCWVAELSELDTLRKTAETRLKSFISQTHDSYVPKFSNNMVTHPRRCVFIGSTNEGAYLPGDGGHTRWLPIYTPEFNLSAIEANRDQLIAEALAILRATPSIKWWEEPEETTELLEAAREERTQGENLYRDDLALWLDGELLDSNGALVSGCKWRDSITWRELAVEYLGMETPKEWENKRRQMEVAQSMRDAGWARKIKKINKIATRIWERPAVANEDDDLPF